MFKKEYFTKENWKHYLKYGPMDFPLKQAMTYYYCFDLPLQIIVFLIIRLFK